MQFVYPDGDDDPAFSHFPEQISPHQHASWSSQSYIAHNGDIMNTGHVPGLSSFSSRKPDYVPDGQVHYEAGYVQSPLYSPSPVSPHHDRYQTDCPDDLYLRHRAAFNSFPEGLPNGYEVEGLRFNEGCRDHNGHLSGERYWELSSYCIPAHYDNAGHYNAELCSLAGPTSQQQHDTPYGSALHAPTTIPQPHPHPSQSHARPNGHIPKDGASALLQPTAPAMSRQYRIDEPPYVLNAADTVAAPAYAPAAHCVGPPDAFDRASSSPRRDGRSVFALQSPSPPLKRLASKDSSDGHGVPPRPRPEKTPSRRQEGPLWSGPSSSTQSVLKLSAKKNSEKKQTLACLFCRERKIACGRPAEGSPDHTCNQCARRQFKCEYPKESRRGQHKRGRRKAHDVNDAN